MLADHVRSSGEAHADGRAIAERARVTSRGGMTMGQQALDADQATFVIRAGHHGPVLCVAGALCQPTADRLVESVLSLARLVEGEVLVDLGGVTLLDAPATCALLESGRRLRRRGRVLRVVAASGEADRALVLGRRTGDVLVDVPPDRRRMGAAPAGLPAGPPTPTQVLPAPEIDGRTPLMPALPFLHLASAGLVAELTPTPAS
jgi:hypothetical protein